MRRPLILLLLLTTTLALLPTALAAAGGGGGSLCAGFRDGSTVTMRDSCFEGTAHTVPAGSDVVAVNEGQLPHTITAVDGSFDSGVVEPGDRFTFRVDGTTPVAVYCTLHGTSEGFGMAGVLVPDALWTNSDAAELATSTSGDRMPTPAWIAALGIVAMATWGLARRRTRAAVTEQEGR